MTAMTPGSNLPLGTAQVAVEVTAPSRLDVSGLLLGENGKVRSDADFVFYNQPAGPGVTHSSGAADTITVDTGKVPADVQKVVVTASPDAPGTTFAGMEPTATVRDAATGSVIATFTPPSLGSETALVVVEVYRRGNDWKVRAVGQGYANGLGGIASDFGVDVEEPAAPVAAPAPSPAPQAPPPQAPQAQPAPAAQAAPAAPAAPQPGAGKINLDKGKVSLQKNQTVSLTKGGRPMLASVRMGLGWEPVFRAGRRAKEIDLDASVIAYDASRKKVDACYFGKLAILNGVVQHSGDNLTGEGGGDDEVITVHLGDLPPQVTGLVFTVNSFSGQKFTEVAKAYCRLVDAATDQELVRFDLSNAEPRTGVLMCKLVRQFSGEWDMTALGEYVDSRTVRGMVKPGGAAL
jgi:stress response protein SCP2